MNSRWAWSVLLAVLVLARPALAQRVVILNLEGDKGGKVRKQVERALKKAGTVEVLSLTRYKRAAAKRKLRGKRAMTPEAVAKVSKALKLDAAVGGEVGRKFEVRIYSPVGDELWSRGIALRKGKLTSKNARRLARAIAVAAGRKDTSSAPPEEPDTEDTEDDTEDDAQAAATIAPPTLPPDVPTPPSEPEAPPMEPQVPMEDSMVESHTIINPEAARDMAEPDAAPQTPAPQKRRVGPKVFTFLLGGTTTWRSYCSRPGVSSCREYDGLPEPKPKGDTVDFSPQVPYAGFALGADIFPFASMSGVLQGLGVLVGYQRGFSLTNVKVQSPSGETPEKQVISVDQAIQAMATLRHYFAFGQDGLSGHAGLRLGYWTRAFDVDPNAQVPLPGSHRAHPVIGADAALPLAAVLKVEVGGYYFVNPKAGQQEIVAYGSLADPSGGATGSGFALEAGISGEVWGPLGYLLRFRLMNYSDRFFGAGEKWPCDSSQCGGAAQETYSGLTWGVTASF